jgi:hypothetical protein
MQFFFEMGYGAPASALSDAHNLYSLINNRSLAKAITRIIQTKTIPPSLTIAIHLQLPAPTRPGRYPTASCKLVMVIMEKLITYFARSTNGSGTRRGVVKELQHIYYVVCGGLYVVVPTNGVVFEGWQVGHYCLGTITLVCARLSACIGGPHICSLSIFYLYSLQDRGAIAPSPLPQVS